MLTFVAKMQLRRSPSHDFVLTNFSLAVCTASAAASSADATADLEHFERYNTDHLLMRECVSRPPGYRLTIKGVREQLMVLE